MRGGKRKGAGRPAGTTIDPSTKREMINTRIPHYLIDRLESEAILTGKSKGRIIERALQQFFNLDTAPSE